MGYCSDTFSNLKVERGSSQLEHAFVATQKTANSFYLRLQQKLDLNLILLLFHFII